MWTLSPVSLVTLHGMKAVMLRIFVCMDICRDIIQFVNNVITFYKLGMHNAFIDDVEWGKLIPCTIHPSDMRRDFHFKLLYLN